MEEFTQKQAVDLEGFTQKQAVDLEDSNPILIRSQPIIKGDKHALNWIVTVRKGGQPIDLSKAEIALYCARALDEEKDESGGTTYSDAAGTSDGVVTAQLPQDAANIPGMVGCTIRATLDGVSVTLARMSVMAIDPIGSDIIDEGKRIPNLDEVLAAVARCESAAAEAEGAAKAALASASNADDKANLANDAASAATASAKTADASAEAADAATASANAAAKKIDDMTVTATGLAPGEAPTAVLTDEDGHYNLALGLTKGDTGDSGVYMGEEEPTDPDVNVWIDPNGAASGIVDEQARESIKALKDDLENSVDGILSGERINTIKLDDSEVWEQGVIWSSGPNAGKNRDVTFGIRTKDFISVNKSGFYEFTVKKMWKPIAIEYNQNYEFERKITIHGTVNGDYTSQVEFSQEKKYKFYITKSDDSGSSDTSYAATINDYTNITDGVFTENYEITYIPEIVKNYIDETKDEKKSLLLRHTVGNWEYGAINGGDGRNIDSTECIRTGYIIFDVTSEILVEVSPNYRAVIFKYSDSGVFEEIVVTKSGSTLDYGYAKFTPITGKKYRISLRKQTDTTADLMWGRNVSLYYNEDVLDDSNKELIVATYAKRMKVCYYGDSIFAKGNGDDENYNNSWQKSVDDYFGFQHIGVGVGGSGYLWDGSRKMTLPDNFQNGDNLSSNIVVSSNGIMQSAFCSWDRITSTIPRDSDIVIIGTGTNDYGPETFPTDNSDIVFAANSTADESWSKSTFYTKYSGDYDLTKRRGAILSTVMKVQVWCPNAMIILTNFPNSRLSNGTGLNATETQKMEYQQPILNAIEFVHKWWGIPLIDFMSSCRINPLNRAEYCADGIHPNGKGYKLLGSVAIGVLKNLIN